MRMLALICFAAMMCGLNAQTSNDTGAMHIAGPLLEDYNSMQSTLESASHYLAKVVQAEALKSPSEAQEIENLLVVMYTPLVVKAKTDLANTAFGGPMADRGRKMVGAFKTALEGLNDGSYIRTRFVAQYVREHDFVKRCFRMKSAVRRLEHKKFAVKLRGFDDAYGEYMKLLADWERGKGSGITASELFMVSKLDRYFGLSGLKYSFERDAEIVDGLLAVLAEGEVKKLHDDSIQLARIASEAKAALDIDSKTFAQYGGELYGPDREKIAALLSNIVLFLDAVKELTDSALDVEAKATNTGYETGKLRKMESFVANESLFAPGVGGPSSDGTQNYVKRLHAAFEDCKRYYLKISSQLNGQSFGWK